MKNAQSAIATSGQSGLSFKVMQKEAVNLINIGCVHNGVRSPRELSLRAGVSEEKARFVYRGDGVCEPDEKLIVINGKEWDDLLSAVDVSLDEWIGKSFSSNPKEIGKQDLVVGLVPQYGASSTSQRPPIETQERIGTILGYSSAFYLKASDIVLPKA
jgi:hypothetical protein